MTLALLILVATFIGAVAQAFIPLALARLFFGPSQRAQEPRDDSRK